MDASQVAFIGMEDKEDWVLRPVMRGLCKYESLLDGTVGLVDVALLNEALDVEAENQYRWQQESKSHGRR